MKYRADIDGLRAVAVLPVILFHAGLETFSGGFVGVDVFFVISGYLITSIILAEKEKGTFSLLYFYERRARRILPALTVVLLTCILFAWLWLLPNDMQEFSQSLVGVTTFTSNILFWQQSGYFDTAAELKPLLHTWSLAVEEQFYILFPMFILLAWQYGRKTMVTALVAVAILSLGLAQWGAFNRPAAAFFLLPTRAWELLIGALVAFYFSYSEKSEASERLNQSGSLLGLMLIMYAILAFDKYTPFPGLYALFPTIGTVLIILFSTPQTLTGKFLSNRLFVGIGLVSYSAYLWHQPLFAFARHKSLGEPSQFVMLALSGLTLFLAYMSWRYVEQPFRQKGRISRTVIFRSAVTVSVAFAAFGLAGHMTKGYEPILLAGLNDTQRAIYKDGKDKNKPINHGSCHFRSASFNDKTLSRFNDCYEKHGKALIVLGDSHGGNVHRAITYNTNHPFIFGVTKSQCAFQFQKSGCHYDGFLRFISESSEKVERVLYTQAGFYLVQNEKGIQGHRDFFRKNPVPFYEPNRAGIEKVIDYLNSLSAFTEVVWIGPRIEPHLNVNLLKKSAIECRLNHHDIGENKMATFVALDDALKTRMKREKNLAYFSQIDAVNFDANRDLHSCSAVYWKDGDHWNAAGEKWFGKTIVHALSMKGILESKDRLLP